MLPPEPWQLPSTQLSDACDAGVGRTGCNRLLASRNVSSAQKGAWLSEAARAAHPCQCTSDGAAPMVLSSVATVVNALDNGGSYRRQQQFVSKVAPMSSKSGKTLVVAYLPRCARECHVRDAFTLAGIGGCCFVSIMHDEHGQSKCFGFVKFSTVHAAMSAMVACAKGGVCLEDHLNKVWHIRASWARTECKTAGRRRRNP